LGELNLSGLSFELLGAFIAGVLSVLSPCVYPLLPISVGYFNGCGHLPRQQQYFRAALFLVGLCGCYTALGVISAQSGIIFGAALGERWFAITAVVILVVFALYTLECLDLPFICKIQNFVGHLSAKGMHGALLMGIGSGFVAAPCTGPILVGFLTLAASKDTIVEGTALLFMYSIGFGIPFIVLGLFTSLIHKLPKPGFWMNSIKFVTAAALFGIAWKLAAPFLDFIPETVSNLNSATLVALTLFISLASGKIGFEKDSGLLKIGSAVILSIALVNIVSPIHKNGSELSITQQSINQSSTDNQGEDRILWRTSFDSALAEAQANNKLMMIDLYADWCEVCAQLDRETFSNIALVNASKKLIPTRIDMTEMTDEHIRFNRRYAVPGLPTILFLSSNGDELTDLRLVGFVTAEEVIATISKAIAATKSPE